MNKTRNYSKDINEWSCAISSDDNRWRVCLCL